MSKDICYYEKVEAKTAFIAGVTEALVESLGLKLARKHYGLDSDVFELDQQGIDGLYDMLLQRLRKYNEVEELDLDLERDFYLPNLPINRVESSNTKNAVANILQNYCVGENLLPSVQDFFFSVNWYLKQPRGVYRTDMQALYEFMPELEAALRSFYLYIITELIFVEYEGYVLLLVVGSSE